MPNEENTAGDDFNPEWEHALGDFLQQPSALFNLYRIAILLDLYHADAEDYSTIRRSLGMSDGHLSTHLRALIETRLIEARKEQFEDRHRTMFHITPAGMLALEKLYASVDGVRGKVGR